MSADTYRASPKPVALDIVDAQLHISLALGEDRIIGALDALGIQGVILDELWGISERRQPIPCASFADGSYRALSPLSEAAALKHPERFSFLRRVSRKDPDLVALMALLASTPGCRAIRISLLDRIEREAFGAGGHDVLLGLAQRHRLPVCVLGTDVGAVPQVAVKFPDLQLVLDHCGWSRSPEHWSEILQLAHLPNVWLKWSHAARAFGRTEKPQEAVQREFVRAIEAFSVERVMWAGDVTHEESGVDWAQLLAFVRYNPALSPGDKEWLLARTARRVFRWEAPSIAAPAHTA